MQVGKSHTSTRDHDGMEPGLLIYILAAAFPREGQMALYTPTILLLIERNSILIYT